MFGTLPGVVVPKTPQGAGVLGVVVLPVVTGAELLTFGVYTLTVGAKDALRSDDLPFTLGARMGLGPLVPGLFVAVPLVFTDCGGWPCAALLAPVG